MVEATSESGSQPDDGNRSHQLVDEAYQLALEKLKQDEVTSEDVVEVGELLQEAMEHPSQDIFTTLDAEGPKNSCLHHKYPDGKYSYPPRRTPRECLQEMIQHQPSVAIS